MVLRNYDDNEYRRNPVRNESRYGGQGGRDDGDYAYPPRIYGRDPYAPDDRDPQRAEHGYRDSDPLSRAGSGDAPRGYEGPGGYGAGGRGGQGYFEGGWPSEGQGRFRDARRAHGEQGQYGLRSDAGSKDPYQYGGGAQEVHERTRQFDPDYYQWRNEQLSALDDDYQAWRGERYKKFADEFNQWRSGRASPGEEGKSRGHEKENSNKSK